MDTLNFFSREKPNPVDWFELDAINSEKWDDNVSVKFIRGCMFFGPGQETDKDGNKINLRKLREFFTDKAIKLLEKDGFIIIK